MNQKLKKAIYYTVSLGIGVVLFYLVYNSVDDKEKLWNDMQSASWLGIALSFAMGYIAIISRGLRWLILLEPLGHKPNRWHSIHAVGFAYFANTFVPRSGELARCAALNQTDDIPVDELFGTVITERIIDTIMLAIFLTTAVISNLDAFARLSEQFELGGATSKIPILVGGSVLLLVLYLLRKKIFVSKFGQKIQAFLLGVKNGVLSVMKIKKKGLFIFHTLLIWTMYFFMAYVIYMTVDASSFLKFKECLFIMVAGGLGMIIPAPGGFGSYQYFVKLGFQALGYDGDLGFALANIIWVVQTGMIVVMGGIGYLALNYYRLKKDRLNNG